MCRHPICPCRAAISPIVHLAVAIAHQSAELTLHQRADKSAAKVGFGEFKIAALSQFLSRQIVHRRSGAVWCEVVGFRKSHSELDLAVGGREFGRLKGFTNGAFV